MRDWIEESHGLDAGQYTKELNESKEHYKLKPKQMKTSKIKEVKSTKDFTNSFGTTIYHSMIMENGDKIQIGKKKLQQVGWELTYEIIEEGQQEFNKAKSVQREDAPTSYNKPSKPSSNNASFALSYAKDYHTANGCGAEGEFTVGKEAGVIIATADKFLEWLNQNS